MALVVPHGGPDGRVAQGGFVHGEEVAFELLIGAVGVGHVTNVEVEVERALGFRGVLDHGVVDGGLVATAPTRVADDPEADRVLGAGDGVGGEVVGAVVVGDLLVAVEDRVVVGGRGFQAGDGGLELVGFGVAL